MPLFYIILHAEEKNYFTCRETTQSLAAESMMEHFKLSKLGSLESRPSLQELATDGGPADLDLDYIDVLHYYVIWTDNRSRLLKADTRKQEDKYPMIKVLLGSIMKLRLYSVNTELIYYRTGNMQSAIHLSFVASSSLPPCGLLSIHLLMPCYISPYVTFMLDYHMANHQ